MKHITFLITISIIIIIGHQLHKKYSSPKNTSTLLIGILQTASHPALDATRQGFVDSIKNTIKNVEFIIYNGEGSISQLHTMAHSFHINKNIDAIFAIATPAAQAIVHTEKEKPII